MFVEDLDSREGLERRRIATTGHYDVGLAVPVIARPVPHPDSAAAVQDGLVHGQPIE